MVRKSHISAQMESPKDTTPRQEFVQENISHISSIATLFQAVLAH
jgi:hypothetical protein